MFSILRGMATTGRHWQAPAYYNTTKSAGRELIEFKTKATSQDGRILAYFHEETAAGLFGRTPSEIRAEVFSDRVPLTSVRRSMSNLTAAGKLNKTASQRDGPYGRPEYVWSLVPQQPEQRKLFE